MPKSRKSKSSSNEPDVKPYTRPSPSSDEVDIKPSGNASGTKKKTTASGKAPGRVWSGDELVMLFETALGKGPSKTAFEGVLDERTALQCVKTWQNTIVPFIKTWLQAKGDANVKR